MAGLTSYIVPIVLRDCKYPLPSLPGIPVIQKNSITRRAKACFIYPPNLLLKCVWSAVLGLCD